MIRKVWCCWPSICKVLVFFVLNEIWIFIFLALPLLHWPSSRVHHSAGWLSHSPSFIVPAFWLALLHTVTVLTYSVIWSQPIAAVTVTCWLLYIYLFCCSLQAVINMHPRRKESSSSQDASTWLFSRYIIPHLFKVFISSIVFKNTYLSFVYFLIPFKITWRRYNL